MPVQLCCSHKKCRRCAHETRQRIKQDSVARLDRIRQEKQNNLLLKILERKIRHKSWKVQKVVRNTNYNKIRKIKEQQQVLLGKIKRQNMEQLKSLAASFRRLKDESDGPPQACKEINETRSDCIPREAWEKPPHASEMELPEEQPNQNKPSLGRFAKSKLRGINNAIDKQQEKFRRLGRVRVCVGCPGENKEPSKTQEKNEQPNAGGSFFERVPRDYLPDWARVTVTTTATVIQTETVTATVTTTAVASPTGRIDGGSHATPQSQDPAGRVVTAVVYIVIMLLGFFVYQVATKERKDQQKRRSRARGAVPPVRNGTPTARVLFPPASPAAQVDREASDTRLEPTTVPIDLHADYKDDPTSHVASTPRSIKDGSSPAGSYVRNSVLGKSRNIWTEEDKSLWSERNDAVSPQDKWLHWPARRSTSTPSLVTPAIGMTLAEYFERRAASRKLLDRNGNSNCPGPVGNDDSSETDAAVPAPPNTPDNDQSKNEEVRDNDATLVNDSSSEEDEDESESTDSDESDPEWVAVTPT